MLRVATATELLDHVGADLGESSWTVVEASQLERFEQATGAPVEYLALSLVNLFLPELLVVEQLQMGVNVGIDGARFPQPLAQGDRVRGTGQLISAAPAGEGIQAVVRVTVEVEGRTEPACVVDTVSRFF